MWLPDSKNPPTDLDLEVARFTLVQVGDQFCDLLTQEADAISIHISEGNPSSKGQKCDGLSELLHSTLCFRKIGCLESLEPRHLTVA